MPPRRATKRAAPSEPKIEESPSPSKSRKANATAAAEVTTSIAGASASCSIKPGWSEPDSSLLVYLPSADSIRMSSKKVAAFDMDSTLITTKSGKVFAVNEQDWKLFLPETQARLKQLHTEGYKLVILSNQLGISKGKVNVPAFKNKVEQVLAALGTNMICIFATGKSQYRKPCTGMWRFLKEHFGPVDDSESMYIGDAAGRPDKWAAGKKKDFACNDRLFALNLGLKFHTPEEFFSKLPPAPFEMPKFDPRAAVAGPLKPLLETNGKPAALPSAASGQPELIIMVGSPGSGKTHFTQTHLLPLGYTHVNRDELGTWQRCVARCEEALRSGKSVVIDNTNPDRESRARYISCARKHGVTTIRCFVMSTSFEQIRHNETFRELTDSTHKPIADMILYSFRKNLQPPDASEGLSEILTANIVPSFRSDSDKQLYSMYLVEK